MQINKYNIDFLPQLNSELHDQWFSLDDIVYDESKNEFQLFYGPNQKLVNKCLKVEGVINCKIIDTEKIDTYDINYLSIDLKQDVISIIGCIPITISLKVKPDFRITIITP